MTIYYLLCESHEIQELFSECATSQEKLKTIEIQKKSVIRKKIKS